MIVFARDMTSLPHDNNGESCVSKAKLEGCRECQINFLDPTETEIASTYTAVRP